MFWHMFEIHILDGLAHNFGIWFEEHLRYWKHGLRCTLVYVYMFEAYLGTWLMDFMEHFFGTWLMIFMENI
jgi:hypothetical protein